MEEALFDQRFYRQQHGLGDRGRLQHYLRKGDAQGLDPSPYFSTCFYKARYPDWNAQGARTAAADFLQRIAAGEARQPHPLIDPVWYAANNPDLAKLGARAVLHFMAHGDAERRAPSASFDPAFYQRCYLALEEGLPFRHFILQGQSLGYLPRVVERGQAASRNAMAQGVQPGKPVIILAAHDAQPAGVPLLTLDFAAVLQARGWQPVIVMQRAGPLLQRFRAAAPVHVLAEGWDLSGLLAGVPADTPVVVNTGAAAALLPVVRAAGLPCQLLIHEMAEYLRDQDLLEDLRRGQAAGALIVASMPRTATALHGEMGALAVLRPGVLLPPTPLAAFRKARGWRGSEAPVFIGAGHADQRKGFDLFLQAAAAIQNQCPTARFVWLGALSVWARDLAQVALAGGLRLTLPGFVPDSLAWYRAADGYLLTSRQDPGPTTVIHAAAMGTPFVGYAADLGILEMAAGIGRFVAPGELAGFVAAALALRPDAQTRRALRRHIRAETGFAPYVDGLLAGFSRVVPDAAT